jgi:anti-anti-sigma regulatory factor
MFLATTNKAKRLLYLGYIQKVRTKDLQRGLEEMPALLADLPPGFHLLVDLGRLESMDPACTTQVGKVMELCDQHGVGLVIRVIPDPTKDIGFNLLSIFHYPHRPRTFTCKTMSEAARLLSL